MGRSMSTSMNSSRPDRRRPLRPFIAVLAPLLLTGCSSDQSNEWDAVVGIFGQVFGGASQEVTYQQAAAMWKWSRMIGTATDAIPRPTSTTENVLNRIFMSSHRLQFSTYAVSREM